jgi:hypothetical protein
MVFLHKVVSLHKKLGHKTQKIILGFKKNIIEESS